MPVELKNQNPAMQSLNEFGGMINKNILQPAAYALDHVNPVTLNRNITSAIQNAPDAMKKYDKAYGDMVRADLYGSPANQAPTTVLQPSAQAQYDDPMSPVKKPLAKVKAPGLEMKSEPMHPVDIRKYDYSTGKAFSTSDLQQHKRDQQYAGDYGLSPYDNQHVTPSNWRSPGKKYNDLNKSELLTEDGLRAYDNNGKQTGIPNFDNTYMQKRYGDNVYRPRTEQQRLAEGKAAHNRVLRGIAAYQNLNHYKRTGEDKPFPIYGGYDLSGPDPKAQQQQFQNELAVRKHTLDIQKANAANRPDAKYKARYSDIVDDNFNVTGSRFDGSFNEATGRFTPAGEVLNDYFGEPSSQAKQQAPQPVQLSQSETEALGWAKQLAEKSPEAMSQYQQLLQELGLNQNWYEGYNNAE